MVWQLFECLHFIIQFFVQCYCESCTSCNYLQVQRLKNVQWRLAEPALLLPWCACVTAPQTICVSLEQRQEKCTCGRVLLWEDLCRLTKGLSVLCTHCARQHKRWVKSTSQVWLTVMLSWSTVLCRKYTTFFCNVFLSEWCHQIRWFVLVCITSHNGVGQMLSLLCWCVLVSIASHNGVGQMLSLLCWCVLVSIASHNGVGQWRLSNALSSLLTCSCFYHKPQWRQSNALSLSPLLTCACDLFLLYVLVCL